MAALAKVSGFRSVGKASVVPISSNSTSSTIADAGRNKSSVAFHLITAVNLAVPGSPNFSCMVVADSNFEDVLTLDY